MCLILGMAVSPLPGARAAPPVPVWEGSDGHSQRASVAPAAIATPAGSPIIASLREVTIVKRPVPVERTRSRAVLVALLACAVLLAPGRSGAAPEGQLTWGVHITLAPTWFDPAESPGMITPYMVFYALHDALVKAMPGNSMAPSLAGPYKFVSSTPGVELVLEAFEQYWRKPPSVRRLVFKVIPDEATRLAALKRGEVDIVYSIRGELAEEVLRTPGLALKPTVIQAAQWVNMLDQWDPKSPWHDRRVRLAANYAVDRKAINQAITLGHSTLAGTIIPSTFDFYGQPPAYPYDPARARQLLAEAGYPNGFDAGEYFCDISYANVQEAILNHFQAVGIRAKLRPLERADPD